MYFIQLIDNELRFQRHMLRQYGRLKKIKTEGSLTMAVRKSGCREFYIRSAKDGVRRYVRQPQMEKVVRIQVKMTGFEGAARAETNIRLLKALREGYRPCDFFTIQSDIDEKYRFAASLGQGGRHLVHRDFPQSEKQDYTEELIHSTSFGLWVRSKNEAQIAEMLYAAGLEFYYEKALMLYDSGKKIFFYPDFTIILPDGRRFYWEHKGLLADFKYRKRDDRRMHIYHMNGIYQPHNLIVTCDGPKGEFPGIEIGAIIDRLLLPLTEERI